MYFVGIDVGTLGSRCCIFDDEGRLVGNSYREYGCEYPKLGWVEQDINTLLEATYGVCKAVLRKSGVNPNNIGLVGFSTQRSVLIPVDADGEQVRNSIGWQDTRGVGEVENIKKEISPEKFYEITGKPITMNTPVLPKLLWYREKEPKNYEKTVIFGQVQDFFLKAFGADHYYIDKHSASWYGFFDVIKGEYSEEILNALDIPREKLPEPVEAGSKVGEITPEVAEKTGFAEGTPLTVGGGDQGCALIGAGGIKKGIVSITMGTAGVVTSVSSDSTKDSQKGIIINRHLGTNNFQPEGISLAAASSYRWFRDTFGDLEKAIANSLGEDPYDLINIQASRSKPGANGIVFLPYLASAGTPYYDPRARGVYLGLQFAHNKGDIARATMEGISMEIKDMIESLKTAGISADRYRITGGATKSDLWNQVNADIFGKPVELLHTTEVSSLGATILGSIRVGFFKDMEEAVDKMVHVTKDFAPNMDKHKIYEKVYDVYTSAYKSLSEGGTFIKISDLQASGQT